MDAIKTESELQAENNRLRGQLDLVRYYAPLAYRMATASTLAPPADARLKRYADGVQEVRDMLRGTLAPLPSHGNSITVRTALLNITATTAAALDLLDDETKFPPI